MSLREMAASGKIARLPASKKEVQDLILKARRRLEEAANEANYPETRLEQAYNAILSCATAALRASGYRVTRGEGQHQRTIETLLYTLRLPANLVDYLQDLRSARNAALYEGLVDVPESDVTEAIREAKGLLARTQEWNKKHHPKLT